MKTIRVPVVRFLGETTLELKGDFDLHAQAIKIDHAKTEVLHLHSQTSEGWVLFSGLALLGIVYVNEIDRTLREACVEIPFTKSVEAPGSEPDMTVVLENLEIKQTSMILIDPPGRRTTHCRYALVLSIKFKVARESDLLFEEPNPNVHHPPGGGR
ncbi:MAG: DUF3794 domain-containing protein [Firmicutes bacterium]|nr:DUF3794 domain-containing protein [Bacillota bacterium]